jgi:phosphoglycerate dehydrogenase-like enzyme
MAARVVIAEFMAEAAVGSLRARFDAHYDASLADRRAELLGLVGGADALIVRNRTQVDGELLEAAGRLKIVGRLGVGLDNIDMRTCEARGIRVIPATGANALAVAEYVVGAAMALLRGACFSSAAVASGQWPRAALSGGREIAGKTLGVIGFGGIGRALVKLLTGFGMKQPLVFDPFVPPGVVAQSGARSVTLDELLSQSDFVSIHCPLSEQTRSLIGPRELGLMKPSAYLINTARGGIVDEDALFAALKDKRIAGAAIDCFANEPLTTPSRFGDFDNVLLAPHCIAWTDELFRDIGRSVCRGLLDLANGKRPSGLVNPEVFKRPSFQSKWNRILGEEIVDATQPRLHTD